MIRSIALLFILFFSVAGTNNAQGILDQSNIGSGSTFSLVDNLQSSIQTFIPSVSGQLLQLKVDFESFNCPYPLVCIILDGGVNGSVVATEVINVPPNSPRSMLPITFTVPPNLISAQVYAIALYSNCISAPGQGDYWYKSVNNAYANGQAYNQWGSTIQPEDTLNDFYFQTFMLSPSGIQSVEGNNLSIYPNPASSRFFIESDEPAFIELFDMNGRQLIKESINTGKTEIDVSINPKGVYFMSIKTDSSLLLRKIIRL